MIASRQKDVLPSHLVDARSPDLVEAFREVAEVTVRQGAPFQMTGGR